MGENFHRQQKPPDFLLLSSSIESTEHFAELNGVFTHSIAFISFKSCPLPPLGGDSQSQL